MDNNTSGTVLITTPSFGQHSEQPWQVLAEEGLTVRHPADRHPLSAAQLRAALTDTNADALIVGLDEVTAEVIEAVPQLRVIAKHGVGVDNIDCAAAERHGVRVVNAPGSNTNAVADLTMALLLAAFRQIVPAHTSTVAGNWDRFFGPELGGRTLALLGFGRIGQAVARRAAGFDMRVIAYDPYLPAEVFATTGVPAASLNECLAQADVLSLHLPAAPDAAPLLGRAELARTKPGACLINTARGGLVDEHALADLLQSGHLRAAAVDAFATEPPGNSPLLSAPNVVVTPHIGAFTHEANAAMGVTVARDVARVLRGETPVHAVV